LLVFFKKKRLDSYNSAHATLDSDDVLAKEAAHVGKGASIDYVVHSHPWYRKETDMGTQRGGTPSPSGADVAHQQKLENNHGAKYGVILGYTQNGGHK